MRAGARAVTTRSSTQKERDVETGLDYFLARYYSSTQGRFTSVDPMLSSAKTYRPESWNRYSYCYNNPLKYLDPDGRKVKPEDEKALENIRNTLPENLRAKVKLDKNGFIDRNALNKIKSKDANFLDLKKMVNSSQTVEVATASSAVLPGSTQATPFSYQSVEQQRGRAYSEVDAGFWRRTGGADG
ncbi:MAG TPA: RHS repeat-associated core domain-containing protein [Pyrinomonadaceae bacterium]|nr:RHS repeat-associated core domain-containing protein [Pyrinomonadaceae bacterium]